MLAFGTADCLTEGRAVRPSQVLGRRASAAEVLVSSCCLFKAVARGALRLEGLPTACGEAPEVKGHQRLLCRARRLAT